MLPSHSRPIGRSTRYLPAHSRCLRAPVTLCAHGDPEANTSPQGHRIPRDGRGCSTSANLAMLTSAAEIENLQAHVWLLHRQGIVEFGGRVYLPQDATYEYGQRGVYVGQNRIRDALALFGPQGLATGQLNNYMMLQPIIDVAPTIGPPRRGGAATFSCWCDGKAYWGEGTYENEYARDRGVWKISKLHFYVTMLATTTRVGLPATSPWRVQRRVTARPPADGGLSVAAGRVSTRLSLPTSGIRRDAGTPSDRQILDAAVVPDRRRLEPTADAGRCQKLADESAVERVQRAYGYYVDKAMWPDVADLFCEAGSLEIGGRGVSRKEACVGISRESDLGRWARNLARSSIINSFRVS